MDIKLQREAKTRGWRKASAFSSRRDLHFHVIVEPLNEKNSIFLSGLHGFAEIRKIIQFSQFLLVPVGGWAHTIHILHRQQMARAAPSRKKL